VAAVGRRVMTLCKHEAGLCQQLALYQVYGSVLKVEMDRDGCHTGRRLDSAQ